MEYESERVPGLELCYERRGAGRPLVLVHGWSSHWQAWEPVLDLLAEHRDVIAVDLPGFGGSPPLPRGLRYTRPTLCAVLRTFFAQFGLGTPDVAGNSLGGLLALDLASGSAVRTATAVCPPGFYGPASMLRPALLAPAGLLLRVPVVRERLATPRGRAVARSVLVGRPDRLPDDALATALTAAVSARGAFPFFRHNRHRIFFRGSPRVPVTLVWGARDRIIPSGTALRARRALPSASQVVLPGCGHVPMSDDPGLVAATVLDASR